MEFIEYLYFFLFNKEFYNIQDLAYVNKLNVHVHRNDNYISIFLNNKNKRIMKQSFP